MSRDLHFTLDSVSELYEVYECHYDREYLHWTKVKSFETEEDAESYVYEETKDD